MLRGERGVGGFKLETAPQHEIPIVIAALRDRMLRLAAEIGDGVFSNFLPLSGVGHVVEQVREAAGRGRPRSPAASSASPGPRTPRSGWPSWMFTAYGTTPVYAEFFRCARLGRASSTRCSRPGRPATASAALELLPEDLVREIFVFGAPEAMKERLAEFEARRHHVVLAARVRRARALRRPRRRAGAVSEAQPSGHQGRDAGRHQERRPEAGKGALIVGEDGRARCWWGASSPEYVAYHDEEWGRPVRGDDALFERLVPRGVPVRALVDHDPAQARELPGGVRRLRRSTRSPSTATTTWRG